MRFDTHPAKCAALAMIVVAAACTQQPAARPEAPPFRVHAMAAPAAPGSGEPNLAVTADGRVFLSWVEPTGEKGSALRIAVRRKGGAWSPPRTIAEGYDWFVNWADFPSVAALPDGTLFAHWLAKNSIGAYGYDVRISVSRDGGTSWSPFVTPHRDGTPTEHGFVSMLPWGPGRMGLVWLDGRKTTGVSEEHADSLAAMQLMQTSVDAEGRLGGEALLDERVCDCCQTAAASTERGAIVVYRDRSATEVRDISVMRFEDGLWSEPQVLAADGWQMNGCPVNGPAIAASGARVGVAWFAAPHERPRVSVVFSGDGGATFGAPRPVDDGRPLGRVDLVLLPGGDALVSWLEQSAHGTELRVRRMPESGLRGPSLTVADSSSTRSSGFPRMEIAGGEPILAWRDAAEPPRVRTAILEPPL
jgi:hypothetical protein